MARRRKRHHHRRRHSLMGPKHCKFGVNKHTGGCLKRPRR